METKVKIFICTHKNFKVPEDLSPELYSIITNGCDIDIKSPFETIAVPESYKKVLNGYDDKVYSEMYMIRYLYDHQELIKDLDYIGFCHYRRFFDFGNNIPALNDENYDAIQVEPSILDDDVYHQYATCHNLNDIELFTNIIIDINQSIGADFNDYMKNKELYVCNLFIISKYKFNQMMAILVEAIDKFIKQRGDILQYVKNHFDEYCIGKYNNSIDYQNRVIAYLTERFTGFFVSKYCKNRFICDFKFIN